MRRLPASLVRLALLAAPLPLGAQSVLLQIRPRVGDTLRVRLDQQSQLTGERRGSDGGAIRSSVTTTMQVFSRAIVEGAGPTGALVQTITDSVLVWTNDAHASAPRGKPMRMPPGPPVHVHVAPSGTVELEGEGRREEAEIAALMPAAFPREPVRVGATWTREMTMPAGLGRAPGGVLRAVFRLDSLARGRDVAYVSMNGEIHSDPQSDPRRGPMVEKGSVTGALVLDRVRGWLVESAFAIIANTSVPMPMAGQPPMRFQMKVTQRVRTAVPR